MCVVDHDHLKYKLYRNMMLIGQGVQGAPIALRMAKAAIQHGITMSPQAGMQLEQLCYAQVGGLLKYDVRSLMGWPINLRLLHQALRPLCQACSTLRMIASILLAQHFCWANAVNCCHKMMYMD